MLPQPTVRQRLLADKSATGQSVFIHPLSPVSGGGGRWCLLFRFIHFVDKLCTPDAARSVPTFLLSLDAKR